MGLSAICIRRPVFATVLSLLVVLVGLVAYDRLTIREYPEIDEPTVSITTPYRGAPAELMAAGSNELSWRMTASARAGSTVLSGGRSISG